jgi:hypothetical protein
LTLDDAGLYYAYNQGKLMGTKTTDKFYAVYNPKTGKFIKEYEFVDETVWTDKPEEAAGFLNDMRVLRFYRHHTRLFDEHGCKFVPVTVATTVSVKVELDKARDFNEAADMHTEDLKV